MIQGYQWLLDEAQRTMEAASSHYPAAALAGLTYTYLCLLDDVLGDESPDPSSAGPGPVRQALPAALTVDFDTSGSGADSESTGVWIAQNTWSPAAVPFKHVASPPEPPISTTPTPNLEDTWVDVSPMETDPQSPPPVEPEVKVPTLPLRLDDVPTAGDGPFKMRGESPAAALNRHFVALSAGACGIGQLLLAGQGNLVSAILGTLCVLTGAGVYAARRWAYMATPITLGASAASLGVGLGYGALTSPPIAQGLAGLAGVFFVVAVMSARRVKTAGPSTRP